MSGLFSGTSLERPVTCEHCAQPLDACTCPRNASGDVCLPRDQAARVRREKRKGRMMTVVTALDPVATDLRALLKSCRSRFATGGTTTPDGFEVQGDHRDALVDVLKDLGYPAKASGG